MCSVEICIAPAPLLPGKRVHYLRPVTPFSEVTQEFMPPWHRFKMWVTRVLHHSGGSDSSTSPLGWSSESDVSKNVKKIGSGVHVLKVMCLVSSNGGKQTVSLSASLLVPAAEDVCPEYSFLWLVATLKSNNSFLKHLGGNWQEETQITSAVTSEVHFSLTASLTPGLEILVFRWWSSPTLVNQPGGQTGLQKKWFWRLMVRETVACRFHILGSCFPGA